MSNIRIDNIAPSAGGTYRNAPRGIAAAWVNFNGTGTPAIRDSVNTSSITDNGTGDYTDTRISALANINYAPLAYFQRNNAGGTSWGGLYGNTSPTQTTTTVRSSHLNASNVLEDPTIFVEVIHGDLA
jgi:hypothetical protein